MNHEQHFKDRLRSAGERVTSPRLTIFRILMRNSPISMPKLIAKAGEDGVDAVTIYRTIGLFRKLGFIQELGLGRNRLFELSDDYYAHHHHFTCVQCGGVSDFDSQSIEAELHRIGAQLDFHIRSHQLEASGICGDCAYLAAGHGEAEVSAS